MMNAAQTPPTFTAGGHSWVQVSCPNGLVQSSSFTCEPCPVGTIWSPISRDCDPAPSCASGSTGWIVRSNPGDTWITSLWVEDLHRVVAIGGLRFSHSSDGISWTSSAVGAPLTVSWRGLAWSPPLRRLVAVGAYSGGANRVMYSPNGLFWVLVPSSANINWESVVWVDGSPGRFVAVSSVGSSQAMISSNGITWSLRNAPARQWKALAWSPVLGRLVATSITGSGQRAMTSDDRGLTWTLQNTPADESWTGVAWISELSLFVAVGSRKSMWSSDGLSWHLGNMPPIGNSLYKVAWSPDAGAGLGSPESGSGLLVAVGYEVAVYSHNGKDWADMTIAPSGYLHSGISWAPSLRRFVVVSSNSPGAMTLEPRCFPLQGFCFATLC